MLTTKAARCFLPVQVRIWNDLPYAVFSPGMLDGFKGCFPEFFLQFSMVQLLVGL